MSSNLNEERIQAQIAKLLAETANITKKTRWYELVLFSGLAASLIAVGKYLM
ncbi:MAG: hypothetical protein V3V40_06130 [Nitrosomonadaceae bacterium]